MVIIFLILLKTKNPKNNNWDYKYEVYMLFQCQKTYCKLLFSKSSTVNKYDFFSIRLGLSKSTIPLFPRFKPIHVLLFSF